MRESKTVFSLIDWFFCDDIREEVNSKVSYMGVYESSMLFQDVPATLPKVFICIKFEVKKGPADKVFLKITQPDGLLLAGPIEVKLAPPVNPPGKPNKYKLHIGLVPFGIQKTGLHKLQISFDGKEYNEIGELDIGLMQKNK